MKRATALALTSLLCLVSFAQEKNSAADHNQQAIREILEQERESKDAAIRRDVAFVERNYSDDYVGITPSGDVITKSESIAARKNAQLRYDAINLTDMVVRVYGNTAVVTARADVKGTDLGADFSGPYRFTRVWVKRNGQWQVVSYQATVTK